jgi:hypothetical protein
MLLFEARDLSTCVSYRSTTMIHFGSLGFESFKLSHFLHPEVLLYEVHDLLMCVFLDLTTAISFSSSDFENLKSQLLPARFFPERFTRSTQSFEMCPPTDRWSPSTSVIQASKVSTLCLYFLLKLMIHRHASF